MTSSALGPQWRLSPEGLKTISENGSITDKNALLRNALDADLKEIGNASLNEELSKGKISQIVLQVQKIRNIAAPKANEASQAAPRMLKLVLTDGISYVQAIETSPVSTISRDKTPPGTKILLNGVKVVSNYALINPSNCTILGGKVPHLYEKWELAKSVQIHSRQSSTTDGAPAWVNFGSRIQQAEEQFKSLDNKNRDASKENSEFEQLRKDAIAEVSTGAIRKRFGGGGVVKQEEQKNYSTNSRKDVINKGKNIKPSKGKNDVIIEDDKPLKPPERVSLFDFLEDKLPVNEVTTTTTVSTNFKTNTHQSFSQNNANNNNSRQNSSNSRYKNQPSNFQANNYGNNYNPYNNYPPNSQNRRETYQKYDNYNSNYQNSRQRDHKAVENRSTKPEYENNQHQNSYNSNSRYENKSRPPKQNFQDNKYNSSNSIQQNTNSKPYNANSVQENSSAATQNVNSTSSIQQNSNLNQQNAKSTQPNVKTSPQNNMNSVVNNIGKMSLNSEFASRSLRQHLNLNSSNKKPVSNNAEPSNNMVASPVVTHDSNNVSNSWSWNTGDVCLAKYWEDGKYYNAVVTAVTNKTCVVKFTGYGNIEEVLKSDCLPITTGQQEKPYNVSQNINNSYSQDSRPYTGSMQFFRSTKTYNKK